MSGGSGSGSTQDCARFSDQAWSRNAATYEAILALPFNRELAGGTLGRARFERYIVQDAHYLVGFGRALAIAAAKAPGPERIVQFARAAENAIVVERSLHTEFFRTFAIEAAVAEATRASPVCDHYVSWLVATAWGEPYEVALGALLPCFWLYAEVGRDIHARSASDNRYRAWIDTYSGEAFTEEVRAMIQATDEAARMASPAALERMHAAFTHACRLEFMFWDGADRGVDWPF